MFSFTFSQVLTGPVSLLSFFFEVFLLSPFSSLQQQVRSSSKRLMYFNKYNLNESSSLESLHSLSELLQVCTHRSSAQTLRRGLRPSVGPQNRAAGEEEHQALRPRPGAKSLERLGDTPLLSFWTNKEIFKCMSDNEPYTYESYYIHTYSICSNITIF